MDHTGKSVKLELAEASMQVSARTPDPITPTLNTKSSGQNAPNNV